MRNKTQERIEELARERAAAAIDLALVEDGIEIGKKMMAEMIATYQSPGTSPASGGASLRRPRARPRQRRRTSSRPASGYLNEVSPLTARASGEQSRGMSVVSLLPHATTSGFSSTR